MNSLSNNGSFSIFPKDIMKNEPILHVVANKRIDIENHQGIIEYTQDNIRIKSKYGILIIVGRDMIIKEIDPYTITVFGQLRSISYGGST